MNKLVETLNEAIVKVGSEAARVWPDMVAQYALTRWMDLVFTALVSAGALTAALACWRRAEDRDYDDGWRSGAILLGGVGVFTAFAAAMLIPGIVYPEAGLIQSLMGR